MSDVRVISWKEAGDISKAVKSRVAKSILEELSEGKKSAGALAKALDHPLNTITYHLNKLVDAGIIKATHMSYSAKGKEVSHYSLVPTPVVITSGSMGRELLKVLGALIVPVVALPYLISKFLVEQAVPEAVSISARAVVAESAPMHDVAMASTSSPYPLVLWFIGLFLVCYVVISIISSMMQMKYSFKKS